MTRLAAILFLVALAAAARAQDLSPLPANLAPRLEDIDRRAATVADLRADFEQTRYSTLVRAPMKSSGTLAVRGGRVRWDTRKPHASVMTIGDGEIRIYYPEERVLEVYEARGDLRELTGSPLPRLSVLRERFTIEPADPASFGAGTDGDRSVALELLPRTDDLREHVARVRVLVDAQTACLKVMEMTDPDGEVTRLEFKNIRVNPGVKDSELDLRIPEGTQTVHPIPPAGAEARRR
ncbi:MAG: outer membrane lipoprotein carrier protein LolA [Phycisphaerales bacterium]|nr:outer membrane lipoprotein carrier protein LolA [Phycisphaerales bacterium]